MMDYTLPLYLSWAARILMDNFCTVNILTVDPEHSHKYNMWENNIEVHSARSLAITSICETTNNGITIKGSTQWLLSSTDNVAKDVKPIGL